MNLVLHRCFDDEIYIDPADPMLAQIATYNAYEPHVRDAFVNACVNARTVLDVGANIGVYAVAAAKRAQRVVAVEVFARNAKMIAINAAHNGVADKIAILPFAAAAAPGMAVFDRVNPSNKVVRDWKVTLDNFHDLDVAPAAPLDMLVNEPVDVVKIDIEGKEYDALRGASRLLSTKPILFMEFSPHFMMDGCGVTPRELFDLLLPLGYQMTALGWDMTREYLGSDVDAVVAYWQHQHDNGWTHVDLMLTAPR
jgi:FkbM family methyltransferase